MMRLPAPRLLPVTIAVTAVLLGLKAVTLGEAAMASDSGPGARTAPIAARPSSAAAAATEIPSSPPIAPASVSPHQAEPALPRSDWPLLQELRKRREDLDRRERALDLRDAALQASTHTLQAQLGELGELKSKLETLEASRRQRAEAGWSGIVKLYESMRPSDAAAIFDALDPRLLVQILHRMNERKAALVMGNMDPDRARLATQMLASYRQTLDADPSANAVSDPTKSPGAG